MVLFLPTFGTEHLGSDELSVTDTDGIMAAVALFKNGLWRDADERDGEAIADYGGVLELQLLFIRRLAVGFLLLLFSGEAVAVLGGERDEREGFGLVPGEGDLWVHAMAKSSSSVMASAYAARTLPLTNIIAHASRCAV